MGRSRRAQADPRVTVGEKLSSKVTALSPKIREISPPHHEHAVEIRGTGRMMVHLVVRAVVGAVLTLLAVGLFVVALVFAWPPAADFWIFILLVVVGLTAGRRPMRAIETWQYVRHTPWRYYNAEVQAGSLGERIEVKARQGGEDMVFRVFLDRRTDELLKRTGTYNRIWFAGWENGRGVIVPAGGGLPIVVRRVVPLPIAKNARQSTRRYVPFGISAARLARLRRSAERQAVRSAANQQRALANMQRAAAKRAERLRTHPPKPRKARTVKATPAKPAKPVKIRTPKTPKVPRQAFGRGRRSLSQFMPKDK